MDFVEFEGKTYEEAIKKATTSLNAEEKDLEIEVKEVDTKGILGLLGSKKIRILARVRQTKDIAEEIAKDIKSVIETDSPEEYGMEFIQGFGRILGLTINAKTAHANGRLIFYLQCDNGDILIGKEGEVLEALQFILRLAIAKRYKQGLRILIDINGYREKRKKALTIMAKRLADRVKRIGRPLKTDPLNPYERRVIHTLFKHNKNIKTKSEGEGHTKKVIISLNRGAHVNGNRR
ncbi:MAG TPA: RNA-binding cell elongation regulator Jag/EloR [Syntrophorhabdaceae bacterium]|nr:RNA-binding cell elongation regulator Jag/EloR [Syntrophorhabdaceae bacterium]HOL06408.1 RNA-binding cell elongation regulator Jag/EloR [Syntrophorhabdaceae bacterium]HOT41384.1 RNA-binding cell elongation regulator Jag/EloR [Syntrophorhabdaceae bacterium]HPP42724.1 RNA-binding cell elongation regulator Jag/EloR [Syntrophorhabdaceae bacterium]HQE80914.1 RNA-binding cell elongation regulator Jag/EloR [Syntrophorhabdaceae bacterium]